MSPTAPARPCAQPIRIAHRVPHAAGRPAAPAPVSSPDRRPNRKPTNAFESAVWGRSDAWFRIGRGARVRACLRFFGTSRRRLGVPSRMPTVREYEAALQRNPADTEAFVSLRKAYRQAQKHDRLVTLYETRAQAIEDHAKAGELFYLAAELRIDQLGDADGA